MEKKVKLSLFVNDMIPYLENPKDSSRKLLALIHELGKVTGYKINTQRSTAFLCTNNERSEREIRNSHCDSVGMNLTGMHEDIGSISGLV